jgi:hypothetical protein
MVHWRTSTYVTNRSNYGRWFRMWHCDLNRFRDAAAFYDRRPDAFLDHFRLCFALLMST